MADNNNEQEQVKRDDNILKASLVLGVLSVPPYLCIINSLTENQLEITTLLFCLAILNSVLATYVNSNIKGRGLLQSVSRCLVGSSLLFLGRASPILPRQDDTKQDITHCLFSCFDFDRHHRTLTAKSERISSRKYGEFVVFWFTSVSVVSILALLNDVVKHFRSAPTKHEKPT